MTKETITQIILKADEGKILTNGETFAETKAILPESANAEEWYEITESDYETILKEQEENASLEEEQRGGLLL